MKSQPARVPRQECDILVIGSGIAGLSFALYCAELLPHKRIVVLSKGPLEENNTRYAQGGIAAVMDRLHDSYQKHINDTLEAGDGLCKKPIVELVVKEAPRAMLKLMDWGVSFDQQDEGLMLGREGGHSANRILHVKDHTGLSIGQSLLAKARNTPNIELRENQFVTRLLKDGQACIGAEIQDQDGSYQQLAHYSLLATGGAGQIYQLSSNPPVATGDGVALAKGLGAELRDMAFVQFHPTVLHEPQATRPFLISEAVRGFGAILRNHSGEDFMPRYDQRGSLATRDIVARAIFNEMEQQAVDHLWLDLRHLNSADFGRQFPTIQQRLIENGIDVSQAMIPITPAAHYFCGGIATDRDGRSSIERLWAVGECASTGLHGANRLASNSLLEALVFARQAAKAISSNFSELNWPQHLDPGPNYFQLADSEQIRNRIQKIMTEKAGIIRSKSKLEEAQRELVLLRNEITQPDHAGAYLEDSNLLEVGLSVVEDSLRRSENRGGFYRSDLN